MVRAARAVALVAAVLWAGSPSRAAIPSNSDLVGFVPDVGQARDVALDPSGNVAYVASAQFGLAVVDVSNPSKPVAIGGANPAFYAEHVSVSGSVATLMSGTLGMRVVDISNPHAPLTKGGLGGTFRAGAMSGRYAYLAETVPGNPATVSLDVVDLIDPTNPTVVGRLNLGAVGVGGVKAIGSMVYLAAGTAGLKIIDASTPTSPRIVASLVPSGGASALAVAGNYAYVSTPLTVVVIDVSTPSAPSIKGSVFALATALAVSNGRLYALNGTQFSIIDASVPTAPRVVGSGADFSAQGLAALGNLLFLATPQVDPSAQTGGLYVIDTTQPQNPTVLANLFNGYDNSAIAVDGGLAVVSASSLGMRILDVSTPTAPLIVGEVSGTLRGVDIVAPYAYFAQIVPGNPATVSFSVLSLIDKTNPTVVGVLNLGAIGVGALKAVGSIVYVVAGSAGLKVIDVSNPQSPRVIGTALPSGGATAVAVFGNYAYVGTPTTLVVVDVTVPSGPRILGSVATSPTALAALNGLVYAISGRQLVTVDASNPTAPRILSSTDNFGAQAVDVIGSTVFLARPGVDHFDPAGGVYVLDGSDPTQPQLVEQILVPGTTRTIAAQGAVVYAGDSASTIDVISLAPQAPPSTPTPTAPPAPTNTPTSTFTRTSTNTPTRTLTPTPSPTWTPSYTQTFTPTSTFTRTPSFTASPTRTLSATATRTWTPTATASIPPTPTVSVSLAGHIRYYGSNLPVNAVSVPLAPASAGQGSSAATMQTQTDVSGQFALNGIANGDWQVEPQKVGDAGQAINAVDALSALQAAVGILPLDAKRLLACDVNGDGRVSAVDALVILQFKVGIISRFPAALYCNSDWAFTPEPATLSNQDVTSPTLSSGNCIGGAIGYHPLTGSASNQDFSAVLFGDCSGNWQPGGSGAAALSTSPETPAQVRLGTARLRGHHLRIPLLVQSTNPVQSLDAEIQYDSTKLSAPRVVPAGSASGALIAANDQTPGHLALALASSRPLDAGRILIVEFDVRDRLSKAASVRLVHATIGNE